MSSGLPTRTVTIITVRERGGGQEQAGLMLGAALSETGLSVQRLPLIETARAAGGWLRAAADLAERRAPNAAYALAPFLSRRITGRTAVVFQGNGFFLIPMLRWLGRRVIAVSDAPPRPVGGLAGLRERAYGPLLRRAHAVVRTFDFPTPVTGSPVIPNILASFPSAARPFTPGPIARLLYVGRLEANKGLPAFLALAAAVPELGFEVYGAGALEAAVRVAAARLPNLRHHGHSRAWLDEPSGAVLVGCAPTEGCWTAGREALLHGIPLMFVPSTAGGPQVYAGLTDKAVEVAALSREAVLAAVRRLEAAIAADSAPLQDLWEQSRPERIARAFAALCD